MFIAEIEQLSSRRGYERWIKTELPARADGRRLADRAVDAGQDELAGGAALAGGGFASPTVEAARQIDRRTHRIRLHKLIVRLRLK